MCKINTKKFEKILVLTPRKVAENEDPHAVFVG